MILTSLMYGVIHFKQYKKTGKSKVKREDNLGKNQGGCKLQTEDNLETDQFLTKFLEWRKMARIKEVTK